MEHAQRAAIATMILRYTVLGLNPYFNGTCSKSNSVKLCAEYRIVLILILMEHAQRDCVRSYCVLYVNFSLNPYFNGTCSKSSSASGIPSRSHSLNPYFNGTCSKS